MQELERFEEGGDRADAGDAEPAQEGIGRRVGAGDRGGVRDGRGARLLGASDLHGDDRLAQLARPGGKTLEAGNRIEALDMQAQRGDAIVLDQAQRHFGEARLRLVAGRHEIGDGQATALHRHIDGDVGGLGEDRDAARPVREPDAAMLVGPQQRAVGIVDQAVAVRPDDRHVACGRDQFRL